MIHRLKDWTPEIHKSCYIHDSSVIIGRVKLAGNVSIWPCASLRGDVDEITIGENSNIQDCCAVHVNINAPVIIGKNVTVGHSAVIHGTKIGDGCLIGMNATVMESEIGEECIIGAGSLVAPGKKIPPRSLVMGVPGKVIRELNEAEVKILTDACNAYLELSEIYKKHCVKQ